MATQNPEKSLDPIAQHSKFVWVKFSDLYVICLICINYIYDACKLVQVFKIMIESKQRQKMHNHYLN